MRKPPVTLIATESGDVFLQSLNENHPVIIRVRSYLALVETMDVSQLIPRGPDAKTHFEHRHKNLKKKGGRPPVDYSVVEQITDLRIAYNNGNWKQALVLYIVLSRVLPF